MTFNDFKENKNVNAVIKEFDVGLGLFLKPRIKSKNTMLTSSDSGKSILYH